MNDEGQSSIFERPPGNVYNLPDIPENRENDRRRAERLEVLDEMIRFNQRMGFYDPGYDDRPPFCPTCQRYLCRLRGEERHTIVYPGDPGYPELGR